MITSSLRRGARGPRVINLVFADNAQMFDHVCQLLQAGHQQGDHTPAQTLNRLFCKHLDVHQKDIAPNAPWLSSANVVVTTESWSKPDLRKLAPRSESRAPRREDLPVIIVRYRGRNCLIDGGSRIHAWFQRGDRGNHPAFVLTVSDDAG